MFRAKIQLLGVNPFVLLPARVRREIFRAAGRERGPIPVRGKIDHTPFRQTLVKYQGAWRLYLNTPVRRALGKDVGDRVQVEVEHDPRPRREPLPPVLRRAFVEQPAARSAYAALTPSRRKEICKYLNALKTEASRARNVESVVKFLCGEPGARPGAFLRPRERASTSRSRVPAAK